MKERFPEEDELVLCTVEKIVGTSVFVKIEKYQREGVINFSEVAPGRIRNIRNYVRVNQKVVCKVLRVDKSKGHIDLSLRRVTAKERKQVMERYERAKDVKIMLSLVLNKEKLPKVIEEIEKKKELSDFFFEIQELIEKSEDKARERLNALGFTNNEAEKFLKLIKEKIKQKLVKVKAEIMLTTQAEDGIERIKKILVPISKKANVSYVAAPRYVLSIEEKNYKEANKKLEKLLNEIQKKARELNCSFEVKT